MIINRKKLIFSVSIIISIALSIGAVIGSSLSISSVDNEKLSITSMTATQGPEITASVSGGAGFTFPVFNDDPNIKYKQIADDLKLFVRTETTGGWVNIDNNASSGWIYDSNFGHFWDGPGGFWFHVTEVTYIRLQSKSDDSVYLDYTIIWNKPERNSFNLSVEGDTTLKADEKGAVGVVLPKIDGGYPVQSELENFVYQVLVDGNWISLDDSKSGFYYRSDGYSFSNPANQWGYWEDSIFGLWFQPITEDMTMRIGYPADGIKGSDCKENYIIYNIKGNPDVIRPDSADFDSIPIGTVTDDTIYGWKMIWNDEFEGDSIENSKWSHETGYYLTDDPNTWGWGNNELEHYTDSTDNSYVNDGKMTIKLLNDPKSFEQNPERTAPYSSGKLVTKDKFSFKYGRIDFCAKLPSGAGIWPALWMLPNDSVYGTWASSGEIDVMEAKGRLNNAVYGTIHYGGAWPENKSSGNYYIFSDSSSYDDGFHVYSCIWEKDKIRWYVDGECYSVIPYTEWYSGNAADNPFAPFDEEFYIIMNLAAGGNFDNGAVPSESDVPCEMQVEYVRVYQADGDDTCSFTDNSESEKLNISFLVKLKNWLMGKNVNAKGFDVNNDGIINVFDLVKTRRILLSQ